MNLSTKQKYAHTHRKQALGYQSQREGRENLGVWNQHIDIQLHIKQINKDLLYNTGNSNQYFVITYKAKESEKIDTYICLIESLYCIPETNTAL